jgi:hypothetical protein
MVKPEKRDTWNGDRGSHTVSGFAFRNFPATSGKSTANSGKFMAPPETCRRLQGLLYHPPEAFLLSLGILPSFLGILLSPARIFLLIQIRETKILVNSSTKLTTIIDQLPTS